MSNESNESSIINKVLKLLGDDNSIKTIGEKLKELRESKNIIDENGKVKRYTQSNLEADTGISIQSIRAYESNKTIPENKNAKILADFFGVTLESLLNDHIDIVYVANIEQTDYSKELGLSNKSIENIKQMSSSLNVFLEDNFSLSFIKKIDLLINIKEKLYKESKKFVNLLSSEYINTNVEDYISKLEEIHLILERYFREIPNINIYINYDLFDVDFNTGIASLKECKHYDEDFLYWHSHLKRVISYILDEITRTNKMLKYEISTELNVFLNKITE